MSHTPVPIGKHRRPSFSFGAQRLFTSALTFAFLVASAWCICAETISAHTAGGRQAPRPSSGAAGQQIGSQSPTGLGGQQGGAQPVRPGQAGQQSGAQGNQRNQSAPQSGGGQGATSQGRRGGQTSNQTDVTPAPPSRNVSPQQSPAQPPPGQIRAADSPNEPAGATTPRAPLGGGGLQLPNTQIPTTNAARQAGDAPATLSLSDAIRIAVDNNLSTLLAAEAVEEARGFSKQLRAALLPNFFGSAFQQNRTLNLRAQGIASGGAGPAASPIPSFVGPFNTFDGRVNFAQSLFSLAAIRDYRSGKAGVRVAEANIELAREQVATFVALSYLNVLRGDLETEAAGADLALAETLLELARDQREAGVATGVDVVRAETRVAQERLRLLQAEAGVEQTRLDLQAILGLPQGAPLTLTDTLRRAADDLPPAPRMDIAAALAARPEIRVAELSLRQREEERKARVADQYPSFDAFGDYGNSGIAPFNGSRPTRAYGVRLNVPIYDGGLTRGRIGVAESRARQAQLQIGAARAQVESDVRLAVVSWRTAAEQVRAAAEQVRLATRELELARERFRAGAADNTEVVQAQAALANARVLLVQSLAQFNAARLNFAAATGRAREFRF